MTIKRYLESRLKECGKYKLTAQDKELIETKGIEEYIFKKLCSKKYRKWALDADQKEMIKKTVSGQVKKNVPILMTWPFGGYKLWRLPSAPEPDWAEFFNIAYYLEYLSPIAAGYKPGVRLVISSDEVIIERMNNIPKSDTDKYTKAFKQLLKEFRKYLPNNLKLEFVKVRDMYKTDEFEKELKHRLEWAKDEWKKFDKTKQEAYLRSSELNIKMNGKEAWHKLSKKEQGEKIAMGPIYHDGYINLKRRVKFVKGEDKIMLFTFTIKGIRCMPLGSTKASANKFWTGVGILERGEKGFKELILSPKQLKKLSKKCTMQRLDLIKLNNFKSIKIL